MNISEEQYALVARMNVMDDPLFQKIAEDPEVCEEILRILLHKPQLKIVANQTQRYLRNLNAHSVILDLLCQDDTGSLYNVEVQKSDNDDHQKRVRFHISNMDTSFVEKGGKYEDLPDVYTVFISSFDLFHENCTAYHIQRAIQETGTPVHNGIHEIYVNTAVDDGTDTARLMQYFANTGSNGDPLFPKLTARVRFFKQEQKGVFEMLSVFDEYAEQKVQEAEKTTANNLLKEGLSIDFIAKVLPSLSVDVIKQLKQQLPQA